MGDFGDLALGVGTLMIAGAIAKKIDDKPANKNTGLFGEKEHNIPKHHKMKWGK